MTRCLLVSVVFTLATAGPSMAGTSYYVTQSGAGSNNGTSPANAWSVGAYNSTSTPAGGDTVFFSGTITSTIVPNSNGNSSSRLVLDFTGAMVNATNPGLRIKGRSYLTINGGTFGASSSGTLIDFGGSQSHDVTINGWRYTGASGGTASFIWGNYCYNLTVSNNTVDNIALFVGGDSVNDHDILIKNNYASSSINTATQSDIIRYGDAYNVTIEGNKLIQRTPGDNASGRHNDAIQTYKSGASQSGYPYGWIIRYNWIEVNATSGTGDTSWLMLELMSDGGATPALKVYSNVFVGDPTDSNTNNGVCIDQQTTPFTVYFYNNTVIRQNGPDNTIRLLGPGTAYVRNNAGYDSSKNWGTDLSWSMTPGAQWDRNFFYQFSQCSSTYTGPHGSCSTDPKFSNYSNGDFSLQSSSPLANAGDSTIGSEYSQGIAPGSSWPNPTLVTRTTGNWGIGAFQSGVAPPSLNPPTDLTAITH